MTHVEKRQAHSSKETIHSGHFMVSTFEAEAQDEFDDLAVPVPDEEQSVQKVSVVATYTVPVNEEISSHSSKEISKSHQQLSIEVSLTKLFKCMTLAYRQKLTSPKWNRFKGIKLRWKDKIRLNNVIWRCWHMQFIKKQNTLVCQFASPLDVDTHQKPETILLEGKYWKRRAEAVVAEYKKWRMFYITRLLGKGDHVQDQISEMDTLESACGELGVSMLTDEDYLSFMSDTLFSTISSHQPFAFPDPREIARGASLADFIQPSLGPLQPNLDDFMELEPLHDFLSTPRLAPVPEEAAIPAEEPMYRTDMAVDSYSQSEYIGANQTAPATMPTSQMTIHGTSNNSQLLHMPNQQNIKSEQMQMYDNNHMYVQTDLQNNVIQTSEIMQNYTSSYDSAHTERQNRAYEEKPRLHYMNVPKIITQSENYNKYNAAIPPSQTAPETVSLLQQPVQNIKYTSNIIIQGRSSYNRDKTRPRISHYSNQMQNSQYQNYQMQNSHAAQNYDVNSPSRQTSPQMQYLQPKVIEVKSNVGNPSSFKMPSPPLAAVGPQQGSNVITAGSAASRAKEQQQFRSQSLPLGAQLNADWSVSVPGPAPAPAPLPASVSAAQSQSTHDPGQAVRHNPRASEPNSTPLRIRSRSTSSSVLLEGGGTRRPPPLNSVASEPSLPKASVMLAQLLSHQHSQSAYKLNSEEVSGSDPKSPSRRGQPSPMGSDVMSPHHSLSPPLSPGSPRCGSPGGRESRRTHMHAEQKRRYNIKNGFDTLQALIPTLSANPTAKISKAAMLQKGAEYIKQLKAERNQIKEEMESLRQQIEVLNNSITNCHSLLPATGAPVSRARAGRLREMFARHVANRTMHNWKYWLFSVVAATLVDSFSGCVSCSSGADLVRTTLLWAEQHCSLVEMRPAVLNSLRVLCTTTEILTNPERLPEEAREAVAPIAHVKAEPT